MSVPSVVRSVKLSRSAIRAFQRMIWRYYETHGRHDLPWRLTDNPYHILVSEVMLQQTQVSRVLVKYPEFLAIFPDVQALADATLSDILRVWQGMGYNRRAIFLQKAAQMIVSDFSGTVPRDPTQLITLPGIGKHTAGSITAFAFNIPTVFIETNIRRTFIHHFFQGQTPVSDDQLYPYIQAVVPHNDARNWYNALMDYGTFLAKTIANPNHKSKHYKKQSPFGTSLRKVRGEIVRAATDAGGILSKKAINALAFEQERKNQALEALVKEGFLIKDRTSYRIT
ncbi:MAG: A/G-specific adenine glycosylase [Patescibacteria group bacterium]